jgi:hypothetical protein
MREIIRKVLLENDYLRRREFAKKTLFKLWDREKSMGKQPVINDAITQTFDVTVYDLNEMLIEWYGGVDKVYEIIKNRLSNKLITTDKIQELGVNVGNYDFTFEFKNMKMRRSRSGGYDLELQMNIIDGGVELMTDGEYIDLMNPSSVSDDLWWEISYEIKDIAGDLIYKISKEYGFDSFLGDIIIDFI